ncbi:Endonuclease domain-containing 1 protein, partial [Ophiophagus hannah]
MSEAIQVADCASLKLCPRYQMSQNKSTCAEEVPAKQARNPLGVDSALNLQELLNTKGSLRGSTKHTAMLLLWILSLAASFLLPAIGEVVTNFKACNQFFLDGKPPNLRPINPARICQRYGNQYRFATMYDRNGLIPMYSAYKYNPGEGERSKEWMIEPQLALPGDQNRKSMELESTCGIDQNLLASSQAVDQDYQAAIRQDRGHLAPSSHQPDQDSKAATFTLTNIVPQFSALNQGQWREYEEHINTAECSETYILVGAVPGNNKINNRVNLPSHIWAAGCCVLQKGKRSWAVIAENNQNNLAQRTAQASMEPESSCGINIYLLRKSQAVSSDYNNATPYNRGHLAPVCHQPNQESKNTTFALTNIVPQFEKLK